MSRRKETPRGQMSRSSNSGPAIMMMPPHIRETFMPEPPLKYIAPMKKKGSQKNMSGVAQYLAHMERSQPPPRKIQPTPKELKKQKQEKKKQEQEAQLEPLVEEYRTKQKESGGEFHGMNCYNTLFVGRLAYEVTERKLLREFEAFGNVKDLKLIKDHDNKSRGYAFVEFEHEADMKRAFRAADGMRLEGREIVVDVERGHTVPNWLPRRLGGGLGGTRLGGKDKNVTFPGRYDPARPEASRPPPMMASGTGRGSGPPPPPYGRGAGGGYGVGGGGRDRPPHDRPFADRGGPPGGSDYYGGPPRGGRDWDRRGPPPPSDRKRYRSRSPPDFRGSSRRRY